LDNHFTFNKKTLDSVLEKILTVGINLDGPFIKTVYNEKDEVETLYALKLILVNSIN